MPPFFHDESDPEKSLFFLLLNLNKRGITLDVETPEGARTFTALARRADVVVETFLPGHLARLGLDHAALERVQPALVMTSITPFGQSGPHRDYAGDEIVAYAMSGMMSISGTTDREPLKHGGFQAQYEAGLNGALATLFTLVLRDRTGIGQHVDVSTQEVVTSTLVANQPFYSFAGGVQSRRRPGGAMFGNVMPCRDGYFVSQAGGGATWDEIADFYGRPELKDGRFADADRRIVNGPALDELLLEATKHRTMAEMFRTASEQHRMLFGIVQTPADLAQCAQLETRDFYQEVEHPVIGTMKVPFRLWNMTPTPVTYRRPAPMLGQHNAEVYAEWLGYGDDELTRLRDLGVI